MRILFRRKVRELLNLRPQHIDSSFSASIGSYFVVEEADLQNVLHVLHSVGHVQIPQRVSQQEHVGTRPQLLEVARVEQRALSLVVDVDQLPLEGLEQTLRTDASAVKQR